MNHTATTTGPAHMPNTLALVVRRELLTRGRSTAYLVSSAALIAVLVGVIVIPTLLASATTYRVGIVGDGSRAIVDTATRLAKAQEPAASAPRST